MPAKQSTTTPVYELRRQLCLSQMEMAAACGKDKWGKPWFSQASYSRIERGFKPTPAMRAALLKMLSRKLRRPVTAEEMEWAT